MGTKQKKAKDPKKGGRSSKISTVKLSNKRLNKLARQGKLKRLLGKKKLKSVVENRLNPEPVLKSIDGSKPEVPVDPDEIPVEEADYEYFARPGRDFSFLAGLQKEEVRRKRSKKTDVDEVDDLEDNYEKLLGKKNNLKAAEKFDTKSLLPTKCKELGVVRRSIQVPRKTEEDEDEKAAESDSMDVDEAEQEEDLPKLTPAEAYIKRQSEIAGAKKNIASICTNLLSSPEDSVGKLKELRAYLHDPHAPVIRKLAMLSLLEVFKDIIPEYRIRVITQTEKHQKMKRETKKLIGFEEVLVKNYSHYLESLECYATGKPMKIRTKDRRRLEMVPLSMEAAKSLQLLAVRCLCDLLVTHPHFNYRSNIVAVIVPFIVKRDAELSGTVCDCAKRLFVSDKGGDVTLEIVRLIGRVIKAKKFNVDSKVLRTFLSLKIKEVQKPEDEEKPKKLSREERFKKFSRKDRKRQKQMDYLEKELKEAAVEDDCKRKLRLNTQIINTVFLTYFRILKMCRRSKLLSVVLEGIAKFAHLINVSFFDDIFAVMTDLVDSGELTYRESLFCIQTAFILLTGVGASLNIDPLRFYTHLYKTLFDLHSGKSSEDLAIAIQCLGVLIGKRRRQVAPQRVIAFVKRLSTLSLQTNANGTLALLALVKNIMSEHPRCDVLFDTECCGSGVFLPELDEPDHCHAQNTSLYELHLLTRSYQPMIRKYSKHLLVAGDHLPAEVSRSSPMELFHKYEVVDLPVEFVQRSNKKSHSKRRQSPAPDVATNEEDCSINCANIDFFADVSTNFQ